MRLVAVVFVAVVVAGGCTGGSSSDSVASTATTIPAPTQPVATATSQTSSPSSATPLTTEDLAGHKYNITQISFGGMDQPIASARTPAVVFTATQVQVDTGCNGITGDYTIADDRMTVVNTRTTTIGCLPTAVATQEDRIAQAVEGTAVLTRTGEGFTIAGGPVTLTLSPG